MRRTANPTVLATTIQPAATTWYSHRARMTTGSWVGAGPRLRAAPRFPPRPVLVPFFPERAVAPPPDPRPARPLPDRAVLPPPERVFRPVPAREPRPPPVPPRPVLPLPREPPVPPPEPPLRAGRAPPGGRLGSITSSGSSLKNSSRAASGCTPRERAEPLGARVAMMTNVTRTSAFPEAPDTPACRDVTVRGGSGSGANSGSRTARRGSGPRRSPSPPAGTRVARPTAPPPRRRRA